MRGRGSGGRAAEGEERLRPKYKRFARGNRVAFIQHTYTLCHGAPSMQYPCIQHDLTREFNTSLINAIKTKKKRRKIARGEKLEFLKAQRIDSKFRIKKKRPPLTIRFLCEFRICSFRAYTKIKIRLSNRWCSQKGRKKRFFRALSCVFLNCILRYFIDTIFLLPFFFLSNFIAVLLRLRTHAVSK